MLEGKEATGLVIESAAHPRTDSRDAVDPSQLHSVCLWWRVRVCCGSCATLGGAAPGALRIRCLRSRLLCSALAAGRNPMAEIGLTLGRSRVFGIHSVASALRVGNGEVLQPTNLIVVLHT